MNSGWYIGAMILPIVAPVVVLANGRAIRSRLLRRWPFMSELNIVVLTWVAMMGVMASSVALLIAIEPA